MSICQKISQHHDFFHILVIYHSTGHIFAHGQMLGDPGVKKNCLKILPVFCFPMPVVWLRSFHELNNTLNSVGSPPSTTRVTNVLLGYPFLATYPWALRIASTRSFDDALRPIHTQIPLEPLSIMKLSCQEKNNIPFYFSETSVYEFIGVCFTVYSSRTK